MGWREQFDTREGDAQAAVSDQECVASVACVVARRSPAPSVHGTLATISLGGAS